MTAFVFAIQRVGTRQPGHYAAAWTFSTATTAYRHAPTGTC